MSTYFYPEDLANIDCINSNSSSDWIFNQIP